MEKRGQVAIFIIVAVIIVAAVGVLFLFVTDSSLIPRGGDDINPGLILKNCLDEITCDGISMASVLHYDKLSIDQIKDYLRNHNFNIRKTNKISIREQINESEKRKRVGIIDYGAGNIRSVFNGFKRVGNPAKIVRTPEEVEESDLLVIPGVGAFADGMNGLKKRKLINPIVEHVNKNKPILGICLGMQLLMSNSEEFGSNAGLDIIKGSVVKFKDPSIVKEVGYVVPQIGWNTIKFAKNQEWEGSILKNVPDLSEVYFVHSYHPAIEDPSVIQAETVYGGQKFCSSFRKNNVYGTQFHPEKSGEIGLQILDNFGQL